MLLSAVNQLCLRCRQQFVKLPMHYSRAAIARPSPVDVKLSVFLRNVPVRFAGHSHWQNIRKTKANRDDLRQKMINDALRHIRNAVRGECCFVLVLSFAFFCCYVANCDLVAYRTISRQTSCQSVNFWTGQLVDQLAEMFDGNFKEIIPSNLIFFLNLPLVC